MAKTLARGKAEDPPPKKSGKRRGDHAARPFLKAANQLTRLTARRATTLPWNILDWLDLWQPGGAELAEDLSPGAPNDNLSPRL
jgi:hypothetical protein